MDKPILKCKTQTFMTVDVYELESYIKKVTGHTYEIVPGEEWNNDSQHRFHVDGIMADYEKKKWDNFKKNGDKGENLLLRVILEGLCAEKYIIPGIYLVDVSW